MRWLRWLLSLAIFGLCVRIWWPCTYLIAVQGESRFLDMSQESDLSEVGWPGFSEAQLEWNGEPASCYVERCMLICNGDEVKLNLCHEYNITPNPDQCTLFECHLKCDGRNIANICDKDSTRRRLGIAELNAVLRGNHQVTLWKEGRVCYVIDEGVDKQVVMNSIAHWQKHTDIIFHDCMSTDSNNAELKSNELFGQQTSNCEKSTNVTTTTGEDNTCCSICEGFIKFVRSSGCWSYVGKQPGGCIPGGQLVGAGPSCTTGNIIHEIGHVLGLLHEHTRPDRDMFIRIFDHNVKDTAVSNFKKSEVSIILGAYDYGSIMHYGVFAYSKNGRGTMFPIDHEGQLNPSIHIGQREGLSEGDISTITRLYKAEIEARQRPNKS